MQKFIYISKHWDFIESSCYFINNRWNFILTAKPKIRTKSSISEVFGVEESLAWYFVNCLQAQRLQEARDPRHQN